MHPPYGFYITGKSGEEYTFLLYYITEKAENGGLYVFTKKVKEDIGNGYERDSHLFMWIGLIEHPE
jgi:hypothetical protein